jgi:hypothetical protein
MNVQYSYGILTACFTFLNCQMITYIFVLKPDLFALAESWKNCDPRFWTENTLLTPGSPQSLAYRIFLGP